MVTILGCRQLVDIETFTGGIGSTITLANSDQFRFDYVFDASTSNKFVYDHLIADLTKLALKGHHLAVLVIYFTGIYKLHSLLGFYLNYLIAGLWH